MRASPVANATSGQEGVCALEAFCRIAEHMGRKTTRSAHGAKIRASVTLPPDLYDWALSQVESREYASLSHAVERGLMLLRDGK